MGLTGIFLIEVKILRLSMIVVLNTLRNLEKESNILKFDHFQGVFETNFKAVVFSKLKFFYLSSKNKN